MVLCEENRLVKRGNPLCIAALTYMFILVIIRWSHSTVLMNSNRTVKRFNIPFPIEWSSCIAKQCEFHSRRALMIPYPMCFNEQTSWLFPGLWIRICPMANFVCICSPGQYRTVEGHMPDNYRSYVQLYKSIRREEVVDLDYKRRRFHPN
jgi:hypothetical protein